MPTSGKTRNEPPQHSRRQGLFRFHGHRNGWGLPRRIAAGMVSVAIIAGSDALGPRIVERQLAAPVPIGGIDGSRTHLSSAGS